MTNLQLLLSIGIPTLAILLGFLHNNSRFNSLEARIGSLETTVSSFGARLSAVEALISGIQQRLIVIEGDLRRFWEILGAHGEAIETLKKRN